MFTLNINGEDVFAMSDKRLLLFLRDDLRIASVKDGCSEGACGTCMVLVDGKALKACVQKVSKFVGKRILTVEGLSDLQCPYYVHGAVAKALGYEKKDVQVIQDVTGGDLGGKEAFPSILACQTAVAAKKANKPVKVIFERREDMEFTSKRHPSICTYKVAVKDGEITGMDIDAVQRTLVYTAARPIRGCLI
ncbi:aerobic-type carbon monoxide dehydrogenase, small subunit CoxS/CutS-like protein [Desulfosporosinus meridiei DSM 13257]|uniref:Aerobic-type carbon monoxide dehydrogenase, small subunit CoxS/CutS-like protein n=1 Tax=Desulfosporosinus meridiei (strain ATCC BAA-275 / DSM 13257 / KCTC 12902 / NCIMB 13706 / S10) TaxID=768704 RepID=J7IYB9_DESMD|nr:molybdopterin cofactor-binding domain-containing protein [Desulfosporosinus meridiei]AFQ45139.1 aerobic-type carbon monoxide dehydrogenase, small subunit CoxS/CutS-like protein [Desulfosporosinus meridiei DSM 13257]